MGPVDSSWSVSSSQWLALCKALPGRLEVPLLGLSHGGHQGRVCQSSQLASELGSWSQVCLVQQHCVYFDLQLSGSLL